MTRAVVAVTFLALFAPFTAQADPINIDVLSATFSTNITFGLDPSVSYYSTTTVAGSQPVSQSMEFRQPPVDGVPSSLSTASASADWLAVHASSSSELMPCPCSFVSSSADFALTFSPLTDGIAPFVVIAEPFGFFTDTFATLFDVTTGLELWRYSRPRFAPGDVVLLPTLLSASHVYDLHLSVAGESLRDSTAGRIQVTGLVAVPEPSSLLLLSAGLAGVGVFMRAGTRRPS
jgi:hypothetical protein